MFGCSESRKHQALSVFSSVSGCNSGLCIKFIHSSDMMQGCVMIIEKFRAHESNSERSDIGDASISQTNCLQESLFL